MDKQTINRIKEFYSPELLPHTACGFSIESNGDRHRFNGSNKFGRPIILKFDIDSEDRDEILKSGGIEITPHELFKALFPEEWEKHKHRYEDKRTESYLEKVKNSIGLIDIKHGHEEESLDSVSRISLFFNTSTVEVGRNKDGVWVAQYTMRTDVDDYDIVRMYFKNKPYEDTIKNAALIDEIESYFYFRGYDKAKFRCWECGREAHWLDIEGNLQEKWHGLSEQYCGC